MSYLGTNGVTAYFYKHRIIGASPLYNRATHSTEKDGTETKKVKIDSYVLGSIVHFSTDITLLYDSIKSGIRTSVDSS